MDSMTLGPSYDALKRSARDAAARDPMDAILVTVLGGAFLFFQAEKGHNPKVTSYLDALVYVSTCVSVGYSDIFARTPTGKAIASALMTFGPALAAAALVAPAGDGAPAPATDPRLLEVQRLMCDKLDAILGELKSAKGPA
jgi:voltage-gated potassium channel